MNFLDNLTFLTLFSWIFWVYMILMPLHVYSFPYNSWSLHPILAEGLQCILPLFSIIYFICCLINTSSSPVLVIENVLKLYIIFFAISSFEGIRYTLFNKEITPEIEYILYNYSLGDPIIRHFVKKIIKQECSFYKELSKEQIDQIKDPEYSKELDKFILTLEPGDIRTPILSNKYIKRRQKEILYDETCRLYSLYIKKLARAKRSKNNEKIQEYQEKLNKLEKIKKEFSN